ALERGDAVGDVERRVAVLGRAGHPGGLARHVVGVLVLVEDDGAALAVPDGLVLLVVLDGQAVGGDVVAVDGQAGGGGVGGPGAGAGAVVGAPGPDVVEQRVVAVVDERVGPRARLGPADPEEDVVDA